MKQSLFYLLLLLAAGCKKEKNCVTYKEGYPCSFTKDIDTIKANIEGTWEWVQEKRTNPLQGRTDYLTPCTEGYTQKRVFRNDTAWYYKNDTPEPARRFAIVKLKVISGTNFPEDEDPVLVYYNLTTGVRQSYVPIIICDNHLILQYQYVTSVSGPDLWQKQ